MTKQTKILVAALALFILSIVTASACEITFDIEKGKKDTYKAGDELVLKVHVVYTHRVCTQGIENTKFKYDGIEVISATKWKDLDGKSFERKLKIKIIDSSSDKLSLNATRTCDKTGGYGEITIFAKK
jgi:hypothetical protein